MGEWMFVSFAVVLVFFWIEGTKSMNISLFVSKEQLLVDYITETINPEARPVLDPTKPVVVKMGIALNQIIDLEEKFQILKTMNYVRLYWASENIKWNPDDYGGVKSIRLPPSKIWTPDIVLYNFASADPSEQHMFNVQVYSDGSTVWLYPTLMSTTCKIDITDFPYDQQRCPLTLGSWTYDGAGINITNRSVSGDISKFVSTGEWEIEGMPVKRNVDYYACCPEPYPTLVYTIIMRRRPLFYVFNLLLPCVIITAITIVGFYLPPASGEKVSLSITTLLSLTVFLLLVAETMPASSESIPLIGWIFIVAIILAASSSAITVLVLGIYHRGTHGRKVPGWLKKLTYCLAVIVMKRHLVESYGFWKSDKISDIDQVFWRRASTASIDKVLQQLDINNELKIRKHGNQNDVHVLSPRLKTRGLNGEQLNSIAESTQQLLRMGELNQTNEGLEEEWHLVALILDRFFFMLFMLICVVLVGVVFGYKPHHSHGHHGVSKH